MPLQCTDRALRPSCSRGASGLHTQTRVWPRAPEAIYMDIGVKLWARAPEIDDRHTLHRSVRHRPAMAVSPRVTNSNVHKPPSPGSSGPAIALAMRIHSRPGKNGESHAMATKSPFANRYECPPPPRPIGAMLSGN